MRVVLIIATLLSGLIGGALAQIVGGIPQVAAQLSGPFTPGNIVVGGPSTSQVRDSFFGTNGGISLSGGGTPAYSNCFWSDIDSCTPENVRARERVFIGNGVLMNDTSATGSANTFIPNSSAGANWIPRDAQLLSMTDRGTFGVVGVSQNVNTGNRSSIGTIGYCMNNTATTGDCWGGYFEAQYNPNTPAGSHSFGIEIDCKNSSAVNSASDPFTTGLGCNGVWVAGGGGAGYGPATPNPANAAITVVNNLTTWNVGLLFRSTALTTDASSNAPAVSMPTGFGMQWYSAAATKGGFVTSKASNQFQLGPSPDQYSATQILAGSTSGSGALRLTADKGAAGTLNCANIGNNSGYLVSVEVMAFDVTTVSKNVAWPIFSGLLTRGANAASTAVTMQSTPTPLSNGTVTGTALAVTADTVNGCLNVSWTPPTSNTDTWDVIALVRQQQTQ